MKLNEQVVSLGLSKTLKELGVKQESFFKWQFSYNGGDVKMWNIFPFNDSEIDSSKYVTAAFTVAELGKMLVEINHHFLPSYNSNFDHGWYYKFFGGKTVHEQSLADCMAQMFIYLLLESGKGIN